MEVLRIAVLTETWCIFKTVSFEVWAAFVVTVKDFFAKLLKTFMKY